MAWGSVMGGKQRCPRRRMGTISPLQSACDFWEPVRALTAGLAPPGSGVLEGTGGAAPGARQGPTFRPGGAGPDGMAAALRPSPRPLVHPDLGSLGETPPPCSFLLGAAAAAEMATSATWSPRQPGARRLGGFLGRRGPLLPLRDLSPAGRQTRGRAGGGGLAPAPAQSPLCPAGPGLEARETPGLSRRPSVQRVPHLECHPPSPPNRPDCCAHSQTFRFSGSQRGLRMCFSQMPGDAAAAALGTTLGKPAASPNKFSPTVSLLASCV